MTLAGRATVILVREFLKLPPKVQAGILVVALGATAINGLVQLAGGNPGPTSATMGNSQVTAWREGGGDARTTPLTRDFTAIDSAATAQDLAAVGAACTSLQSDVAAAQAYAPIPDAEAQAQWSAALDKSLRAADTCLQAVRTTDYSLFPGIGGEVATAGSNFAAAGKRLKTLQMEGDAERPTVASSPPLASTEALPPLASTGAPAPPLTVVSVFDGTTITASDGRTVRVGGVVVRSPKTCGGKQALDFTNQQLPVGSPIGVTLFGTMDENGHPWAQVQVLEGFAGDLGKQLALLGYAEAYNQGASPDDIAENAKQVTDAKSYYWGQWGPPCGPKDPDDAPISSGSSPSGHIDVDDHHHNLRDGALTGGFCARHWWC